MAEAVAFKVANPHTRRLLLNFQGASLQREQDSHTELSMPAGGHEREPGSVGAGA